MSSGLRLERPQARGFSLWLSGFIVPIGRP
jgi:hypothetical protein